MLGDLLLLNAAIIVMYALRPAVRYALTDGEFLLPHLIISFSWLVISLMAGLYRDSYEREAPEHFSIFTKSYLTFTFFSIVYTILLPSSVQLDKITAGFLVLVALLLVFWRIILLLYRKNYRKTAQAAISSVVVGSEPYVKGLLRSSALRENMGVSAVYCHDVLQDPLYAGSLPDLITSIKAEKVDNLIITDRFLPEEELRNLIDEAEHQMVRVYFTPNFENLNTYGRIDTVHRPPLINLMAEPLANPKNVLVKRAFDVIFSLAVILFILSWLTPIVALIIKLESKGPVFFRQARAGYRNEVFQCLKFRSMRVNDKSDQLTTRKNDSRVTRFGAFLRKTSIDEMPQFFNVLAGQMSVVGPRPHMISQNELYSKIIRKYMLRHLVKPGITGWAQVMGSRGEIFSNDDMQRRIEKDIYYIKNWSLFLDLKIIFLTFYNVVRGDEQAY